MIAAVLCIEVQWRDAALRRLPCGRASHWRKSPWKPFRRHVAFDIGIFLPLWPTSSPCQPAAKESYVSSAYWKLYWKAVLSEPTTFTQWAAVRRKQHSGTFSWRSRLLYAWWLHDKQLPVLHWSVRAERHFQRKIEHACTLSARCDLC